MTLDEAAARRRALAIARRMLDGELAPQEGARAMHDQVWAELRLPELAGFVAAADEWHTCPELRDALAADALRGARELVERWGGLEAPG